MLFRSVKEHAVKKTKLVYVCGLGAVGSLGLPKFYRPDKKRVEDYASNKDATQATFRRLPHLGSSDKISDIACGYGFTIIAAKVPDSSHSVFGFGLNTHSQLGYQCARPGSPLEIVSQPLPIWLPTDRIIKQVSCGRSHTLCLSDDGKVFSLGNNSFGQCGRPIIEDENYFGSKRVHHIEGLASNLKQIECGQDHSFFLTDTGELYACGWGADGQTGLGHMNSEHRPTRVKGDIEGTRIVKVSSCADTTLALDDLGNVFGWGNAEYSQFKVLANEDCEQFVSPRHLEMVNTPGKIIDIAAGGTICAVLTDRGQLFVWGFGILGKGPGVNQSSYPTLIPESLFGMNPYNPDVKVVKIFAGLSQLSAITNRGDLYSWGRNRGFSLGFKHRQHQYFPLQVDLNLASVLKIAMSVDHSCALVERVS